MHRWEYDARSRERRDIEELKYHIKTLRNVVGTIKGHMTYKESTQKMLRRSKYEWGTWHIALQQYSNLCTNEAEILKSKLWNLIQQKYKEQFFNTIGLEGTSSEGASQNDVARAEVEFNNTIWRAYNIDRNQMLAPPVDPQVVGPPPPAAISGHWGHPSSVRMQYPPRPEDPPALCYVPPTGLFGQTLVVPPPPQSGMPTPSRPGMPPLPVDIAAYAPPYPRIQPPPNPQQPPTPIYQHTPEHITTQQQNAVARPEGDLAGSGGNVASEIADLNTITADEDFDLALLIQQGQIILQQQQDAGLRAQVELDNILDVLDYDLALLVQQARAILQQEQDAGAQQEQDAAAQQEQDAAAEQAE